MANRVYLILSVLLIKGWVFDGQNKIVFSSHKKRIVKHETVYLFFFVPLFLFQVGCTKEQYVVDLTATLNGKIISKNQFNREIDDAAGFSIALEGSDPLLFAVSDSSGFYEIKDIPTGTYNIIINKEG